MKEINLTLLPDNELPQTDEPKKKERKAFRNILFGQINRLMDHFKVEQAHIVKAIPLLAFSTLSGWVNGEVSVQLLDSNVKAVANYFGVSVDYLAFSTPVTDRDIELEDLMPDFDYGDLAESEAV